ncbi:hypothetical protein, partial [Mycoplasmopsis bovis]|uniref:hypothetical protein n=1 Tax=Mycoplasmopsis bovis TaxID=28903 RepID=UPI003D27F964
EHFTFRNVAAYTSAAVFKQGKWIEITTKNSLNWNPLQQIWDELHSIKKEDLSDDNYNKAFEKIIEITDALP